jgi:copper chaperone
MIITSYLVSGMTCGHCVSAVTEEIGKLDGVTGVEVDLVPGSNSRVAVTSTAKLPAAAVAAAVEEAGYGLAGVSQ